MEIPMQTCEKASENVRDRRSYAQLLNLDDERVMRELQAGNTDAFAVIFSRHHKLVHLIALRILRDAGEAEDLTQSVFLEIYRKMGQFDSARGNLKGWLLQYAYCRSINRLNYLKVRQFRKHSGLEDVEEKESLYMPAPARQEAVRLSAEALALLPGSQKETTEMYFFEGLTLKEIAERRNETFSNVRHHYYRGLDCLREILKDGIQSKNPGEHLPSQERNVQC